MATTVIHRRKIEVAAPTRQRVMGIIFLLFAALTYFIFIRQTDGTAMTRFVMTPAG